MWPFKKKPQVTTKESPILGAALFDGTTPYKLPLIGGAEEIYSQGYSNPVIYFAVNTLASGISEVPFKILVEDVEIDDKHELYQQIQRPNKYQDFSDLVYSLIANKALFGVCAAHIIPVRGAEFTLEIFPLPTMRFEVLQDKKSGEPISYTIGFSNQMKFQGKDLDQLFIHQNWNPRNPFIPLAPATVCNDIVNTSNLAIKKGYFMLDNATTPAGVLTLETDSNVGETVREEMKRYIADEMGGVKNAGKVLMLQGKGTYHDFKPNEADLSLLEMRRQVAREILMIYRIPENLAFGTESTFANLAAAKRNFQVSTLKPLGDDLYAALGRRLSLLLGKKIEIKACWDETDAAKEYRAHQLEIYGKNPFISINEGREMFGFEKIDNPEYDEPIGASKLPIGPEGDSPKAPA